MTAIILLSITQLTILGVLAFVGLLVVATYLLASGTPKPIFIQLSTADVIVLMGAHDIISELITDGELVMPEEKLKELESVIGKFKTQSATELLNRRDELVLLKANKKMDVTNFSRL